MSFRLTFLKIHPEHFLRTEYSSISKRGRGITTEIFSTSGVWENELSLEMLKQIDRHWNDHVRECRPYNEKSKGRNMYILSMFPYPSGKLHMGHVRVYSLSDSIARFYRMRGFNVIHPIGWDAFGLPAENAAFEKKSQPAEWTAKNIAVMRQQLLELGFSFDWDREFSTCDPKYYKWTQFLFLQMFHKGYVYRRQALVNWDPVDQTVLADEQVDENGCSWRSGAKVEKKCLRQWFIRTSAFSKSLFEGLSDPILQRWKDVIEMQKSWIGECNGYIMDLRVMRDGACLDDTMSVWIEKPELIYGVAFIIVGSNHFLNSQKLESGIMSNISAVHPLTNKAIPIFVDNALSVANSTGTRIGIPCACADDRKFSEEHQLQFFDVVEEQQDGSKLLCNSEEFTGLPCTEARKHISSKMKDIGVTFYPASSTLRDWLISRQRYWGTPIPMVHCQNCGVVPVPYKQLPVILPEIMVHDKEKISPLASATEWLNTKCPQCGNDAKRETDTMDTFVDSSWYYMRYLDAKNENMPFDPSVVRDIMPVNLYIGGKEHAVLHLYYARFVSQFLHSLGYLKHPEPFSKLLVQGLVTAESYKLKTSAVYVPESDVDFSGKIPVARKSGEEVIVQWEKMSKSKFNGVEAEDMVKEYGVDLLRMCMLAYYSPHSQRKWKLSDFIDLFKWNMKLWLTVKEFRQARQSLYLHKAISTEEREKHEHLLRDDRNGFVWKITLDMEVYNDLKQVINDLKTMSKNLRNTPMVMWKDSEQFEKMLASLIIMMAPIAPHFALELWAGFCDTAKGGRDYDVKSSVLDQRWPQVDQDFVAKEKTLETKASPVKKSKRGKLKGQNVNA